jgi:Raf kinase inhibitor-like YbhB/YbcL family protein
MKNTTLLLGAGLVVLIIGGIYFFNNRPGSSNYGSGTPAVQNNVTTGAMTLTSSAFQDGGSIPSAFTCDATPPGTNPPLSISGVPSGATSLALLLDDPDVPKQVLAAGVFDHWVLFNIPPTTSAIAASSTVGVSGANGAGNNAYTGPCPPPQYEPSEHRYFFRLYALDTMLSLQPGATKQQVLDAMQGHILTQAQLVGKYKRIQK